MKPRPVLYPCKDCGIGISDLGRKGGRKKERCDPCRSEFLKQNLREAYAKRKLDSTKYQRYLMSQRRCYLKSAIPKLEIKIITFQKEIERINQTLSNPQPITLIKIKSRESV